MARMEMRMAGSRVTPDPYSIPSSPATTNPWREPAGCSRKEAKVTIGNPRVILAKARISLNFPKEEGDSSFRWNDGKESKAQPPLLLCVFV
jgi:hypothetical protein